MRETSPSPMSPRGKLHAPLGWGATVVGVALVLWLPGRLGYGIIDDAFISLRYAQNLAAGNGLVFNVGEWVEGYTNFLWTLLLALGLALGAEGPGFAIGAGQVAASLTLVAAMLLHRRVAGAARGGLTSRQLGWRVASTPLAVALSPIFLAYAVSGLESTAYAFLLTLHAWFLLGRTRGAGSPGALVAAGFTLALANLTRPEASAIFLFDCAALVLLWYLDRGNKRDDLVSQRGLVGFVAAFALPFGAFLLWRHATYGQWLPNTYYAKVGGPSSSLLGAGGDYALAVGLRTLGLLAVPLGLVAALRRRDLRLAYLASLTLVLLIVIALVGGDHMALWRFGLPLLPFSALLVREGLEAIAKDRLTAPLGALLVLSAFGGAGLWTAQSVRMHDMSEHARAQFEVELAQDWSTFGRWLARYADPDDSIALLPIGAIGFYSGLNVIDQVGLIDEHIAHLEVETGAGYVGHEKFDNDYVLSRRPRFVMGLHRVKLERPISQANYDASPFFEVHRDLLRRPELHRDYEFRCIRGGQGTYYAFYERR